MKEFLGKNVTIMSCSDCNIKCKHCYISYKGNFTAEQLINLATELKKKYIVRINGTEPLLHKDFLDTYKLLGQYGALTNGLVFKNNYKYLDELKSKGIKELKISYHFDFHNTVSKVDKLYLHELFKEIKKRNMNFDIMCTVTSLNYKNIPQYCEEAFNLGASAIKFTNFLNQGNAQNMDKNLILNKSQLNHFFEILHSIRQKYDKEVFKIKRCGSFGDDINHESNFKCIAGTDMVCITPDLNVYSCIFLAKPGFEIGKVINNKIYIYDEYYNDGKKCCAYDKLNNKK